jgi:hypothetical protein
MSLRQLRLRWKDYVVLVIEESPALPRFDPRSADNACAREREYFPEDEGYRPNSRHRVSVMRDQTVVETCILFGGRGATGVHGHSAFVREDTCHVAVGAFVCALKLPGLELAWAKQADFVTCFGIYDAPAFGGVISHGELEIARLSYEGQIVWSAKGEDIFTGQFTMGEEDAEVVDFNGMRYRVQLASGQLRKLSGDEPERKTK